MVYLYFLIFSTFKHYYILGEAAICSDWIAEMNSNIPHFPAKIIKSDKFQK